MAKYKFYEKAPAVDYNAQIELKVEKLYSKIDELLSEAEFEIDNFFDPDADLVTSNMAKINKLIDEIEKYEEVDHALIEERYAALDNWVFDQMWAPDAPDGDEDVLGYM